MMESVYYEASKPGSYGGIRPLARYSGSPIKTVTNWLSSQDTYTLHKPIRKIFPRRKTFAKGINDLFQADLVEMQSMSRGNEGNRYILTCVDVFSKYGFAIPLKDKKGPTVSAALETIFSERTPTFLQTDRGVEFLNHHVQDILRKHRVQHYSSLNDDIKAACVERFNRTLKSRIYRYLTHHHTNRWVDALQPVVDSYNRTVHRSIGMSPIDVTPEKEDEIAHRLYPPKPKLSWKYQIGDRVRIGKYKNVFAKGYLPNWTEEIFSIAERHPTHPITYGLIDASGEAIKGKFYEQEIQKVEKTDDVYEVERVLKTRKRDGQIQYYVQWKGYPSKFNSWTTDVFKA